jgi:hypothetical protein
MKARSAVATRWSKPSESRSSEHSAKAIGLSEVLGERQLAWASRGRLSTTGCRSWGSLARRAVTDVWQACCDGNRQDDDHPRARSGRSQIGSRRIPQHARRHSHERRRAQERGTQSIRLSRQSLQPPTMQNGGQFLMTPLSSPVWSTLASDSNLLLPGPHLNRRHLWRNTS